MHTDALCNSPDRMVYFNEQCFIPQIEALSLFPSAAKCSSSKCDKQFPLSSRKHIFAAVFCNPDLFR